MLKHVGEDDRIESLVWEDGRELNRFEVGDFDTVKALGCHSGARHVVLDAPAFVSRSDERLAEVPSAAADVEHPFVGADEVCQMPV
ncbi:hypothetical protein GCM10027298_35070 [Epidermidibacterium keratini]